MVLFICLFVCSFVCCLQRVILLAAGNYRIGRTDLSLWAYNSFLRRIIKTVRVLSLRIVVKNIDARIKNIKKQVYPIIKKHEKTFF